MASSGKIEIEKFNGQSFELWKLKMEDLLVDKDQWIAVDPGTKPTGVTDEEWKKLDRKAKSTIRLCVSDSVLLNVSGERNCLKHLTIYFSQIILVLPKETYLALCTPCPAFPLAVILAQPTPKCSFYMGP